MVRSKRVILDRDIAELYEVETKALKQAVKRNISRFPEDFMFQLTKNESDFLRSQIVTLEKGRGHYSKYLSYAFTEQGVAMLSSVLNSEIAIQINIQIMRAFTKIRQIYIENQEAIRKIGELDKKYEKYLTKHGSMIIVHEKMISGLSKEISEINRLLAPSEKSKQEIGFKDRK